MQSGISQFPSSIGGAGQAGVRPAPTKRPTAAAVARMFGEQPRGPALTLLLALWVVLLFDPQWYLAAYGISPALKIPVLLFAALLASLAFGIPSVPAWRRRWTWYAPYLMYILIGVVMVPFCLNNGYARQALLQSWLYWALIVGTIPLIDSARRAEWLLVVYGLQFFWWSLWGARTGQVGWHHAFANFDGYGAFAVGGLGMCYFLGGAAHQRWFRRTMYVTAALCVMGVVATFARGAFLAACALFFVIFARSPRKGRTLAAGVVAMVIITVAASVLHPENSFWAEIKSVFEEGTSEGTGEDRWELWMAAVEVWKQNPILGTGPRNWGVYAASYFEPGDIGGMYENNPGMLYDRSLHSFYFTTLAELGVAGCIAVLWILVDFWRRNAALRSAEAERRWAEMGGRMKLRPVAIGLEACMVAFLVTAAFYALSGIHWLYTLLALNLMLHSLTVGGRRKVDGSGRAKRRQVLAAATPLPPGLDGLAAPPR